MDVGVILFTYIKRKNEIYYNCPKNVECQSMLTAYTSLFKGQKLILLADEYMEWSL